MHTAWWAHMHRFLSVCQSVTGQKLLDINLKKNYWTVIHISQNIVPRVMKFGHCMDVDDAWVDLEGQGQRSRSPGKKSNFRSHLCYVSHGVRLMGNLMKQWCPSLFHTNAGGLTSTSSCIFEG